MGFNKGLDSLKKGKYHAERGDLMKRIRLVLKKANFDLKTAIDLSEQVTFVIYQKVARELGSYFTFEQLVQSLKGLNFQGNDDSAQFRKSVDRELRKIIATLEFLQRETGIAELVPEKHEKRGYLFRLPVEVHSFTHFLLLLMCVDKEHKEPKTNFESELAVLSSRSGGKKRIVRPGGLDCPQKITSAPVFDQEFFSKIKKRKEMVLYIFWCLLKTLKKGVCISDIHSFYEEKFDEISKQFIRVSIGNFFKDNSDILNRGKKEVNIGYRYQLLNDDISFENFLIGKDKRQVTEKINQWDLFLGQLCIFSKKSSVDISCNSTWQIISIFHELFLKNSQITAQDVVNSNKSLNAKKVNSVLQMFFEDISLLESYFNVEILKSNADNPVQISRGKDFPLSIDSVALVNLYRCATDIEDGGKILSQIKKISAKPLMASAEIVEKESVQDQLADSEGRITTVTAKLTPGFSSVFPLGDVDLEVSGNGEFTIKIIRKK